MLLAAIVVSLLAQADPLAADVNGIYGCLPLAEALPQLSKSVKLSIDPQFADRMVFIAVRHRPLQETMDKVAETMGLTWFQSKDDPNAYLLKRSAAQEREIESAAKKRAAESITACKHSVSQMVSWGDGPPEDPKPNVINPRVVAKEPLVKAVLPILQSWTDSMWSSVFARGFITYSSVPTSAQRQLKPSITRKILDLMPAKTQWDLTSRRIQGRFSSFSAFDPTKVQMVNIQISLSRSIEVKVSLMSIGREELCSASWYQYDATSQPYVAPPKIGYFPPKKLVDISNDGQWMKTQYTKWTDEHIEFLEPLDILCRPLLSDISERFDISMVVWLKDQGYSPGLSEIKTLRSAISFATNRRQVRTEHWLTTPADPAQPYQKNSEFPRRSLRLLHGALINGGFPSLDTFAVAIRGLGRDYTRLASYYVSNWARRISVSFFGADTVQFWGMLSPQQKETILKGEGLEITELAPGQQEFLTTYIKNSGSDWTDCIPAGYQVGDFVRFSYEVGSGYHLSSAVDPETSEMRYAPELVDLARLRRISSWESEYRTNVHLIRGPGWKAKLSIELKNGYRGSATFSASRVTNLDVITTTFIPEIQKLIGDDPKN